MHRVTIKQVTDEEFETRNSSEAWSVHCSCGELDELRTSEERALRSKQEHLAAVHAEEEAEAEDETVPAEDPDEPKLRVQKSNVPPPPRSPSAEPNPKEKK